MHLLLDTHHTLWYFFYLEAKLFCYVDTTRVFPLVVKELRVCVDYFVCAVEVCGRRHVVQYIVITVLQGRVRSGGLRTLPSSDLATTVVSQTTIRRMFHLWLLPDDRRFSVVPRRPAEDCKVWTNQLTPSSTPDPTRALLLLPKKGETTTQPRRKAIDELVSFAERHVQDCRGVS